MRLLLVEDDPLLGDGLATALKQSGYQVEWIVDGDAAQRALRTDSFNLIVLDLGLPKRSGMSILKELRSEGNKTPVLILTARDGLDDRVAGLDNGADDYITKPFDLEELTARLRAIHRRQLGEASPVLHYKSVTLDPAAMAVTNNSQPVNLTRHEFSILETLFGNIGKVVTKEHFEESIYGWDAGSESNTIEVHMHHLRKKLGKDLIQTVRGAGYLLPALTESDNHE